MTAEVIRGNYQFSVLEKFITGQGHHQLLRQGRRKATDLSTDTVNFSHLSFPTSKTQF